MDNGATASIYCEGPERRPHQRVTLERFGYELIGDGPGQWSWMPDQSDALTPGLREWAQYQFACPECTMRVLVKDMDLVRSLLDRFADATGGVPLHWIDFAQRNAAATRRRST